MAHCLFVTSITVPSARTSRQWSRPLITGTLGVIGVAVFAAVAIGRTPLNLYDVSFSLDWGRELISGAVPDVRVFGASTPHPLSILFGALAALFGASGLDVMRAVVFLSAGAVCVALYRLGRACGSRAMALLAPAALLISEPFLFASLGQGTASDLPALAAMLGALALEAARPRRGTGPLVLLAIAGMWRPEAWLLSLAYLVYCAKGRDRRELVRLGVIAASAPVVWTVADLILTGNPLYSLTYTHDSAAYASRPTGLAHVPGALYSTLSDYLSAPVLAGGAAGIALNLWRRRLPRTLGVVFALTVLGFAALGAAGLPLNERYAGPTTALMAIYFGYFVVGWHELERGPFRLAWMFSALAVVGLIAANVPSRVAALKSDRDSLSQQTRIIGDLQKLVRPPEVREALNRASAVYASYRIVPVLAYDLSRRPRTLVVNNAGIPDRGAIVLPASTLAKQMFETHGFVNASLSRRGYALAYSNANWRIYVTPADDYDLASKA
jgi:hypothetical protein